MLEGSDDTFDNGDPAAEDTSAPSHVVVAPVFATKPPFVPTLVAFFALAPVAVATCFSGSPGGDVALAGSIVHIRNRSSFVPRFFLCVEGSPAVALSADIAGIASHFSATPFH